MDLDTESHLLDFCTEQHRRFDARAWLEFSVVSRAELSAAARYLAGTSWYGHQPQLGSVAGRLTTANMADLFRETQFDPSRFSHLLKARLRYRSRAVAP